MDNSFYNNRIITIIACQEEISVLGSFIDVDNAVNALDKDIQEMIPMIQAGLDESELRIYNTYQLEPQTSLSKGIPYSKEKLAEMLSYEKCSELSVHFYDKKFIFMKVSIQDGLIYSFGAQTVTN
jgi:hypothetical protein